jgi:hypothetical protein
MTTAFGMEAKQIAITVITEVFEAAKKYKNLQSIFITLLMEKHSKN